MKDFQIRYFLAIVNNGMSFTNASKVLYIAQPALSRNIATLEEELGLELFDTSNKNTIKLTTGGEYMYQFFTKYMDKLQEAILKARKLNNLENHELKIGVLSGWNIPEISERINIFSREHRKIFISIEANDSKGLEWGLFNKRYDLVIAMSSQFDDKKNLNVKSLFALKHMLLFSTSHKLASRQNLSILDFKNETLYVIDPEITPLAKSFNEAVCNLKGFVPKIKLMPNLDSILLALESGLGYTMLDARHHIIHDPYYKHIELDLDAIQHNISAVWKKDNSNHALNIFLKECLKLSGGKDK
ncbi:LysR family transcriptional regulator [Spirochaetia bacterium]|nr:LysR family transcriptional regulator [Spirochaetia bacterium]